MKYLGSILCVEGFELIRSDKNPNGFLDKYKYDDWRKARKINVHGNGGNGRTVFIEYESLPEIYKNLVKEKICGGADPYEYMMKQPIRDLIKPDLKAIHFFDKYRKTDGSPLASKLQNEYSNDAAILNCFQSLLSDKKKLKKDFNTTIEMFWAIAIETVGAVAAKFPNTLPTSEKRLKERYNAYKNEGYEALISKRVGNDNRRKVDNKVEVLILSLYAQYNKPYAKEVREKYMRFLQGEIEIIDVNTGEMLNRNDFYKDGEPVIISESTVHNYLNYPHNRPIVDSVRMSDFEFKNFHRPHHHRHAPVYAFSKITMDDQDIPFKMHNNDRVKSYKIMDVASGCIIGTSFGRDKNAGLFLEAIVDMFRLIASRNWGMPGEIEVEHHISSSFRDTILNDGTLFPFVRFCNPRNPQEKRAEHFIRGFKYGKQKKVDGFQHRPFAKLEVNRFNEDADKVRYSFDEIVGNEKEMIKEWNNDPHHDQKKYPGMTRWQVLCEMQNPNLLTANISSVLKHIGQHTPTSIRRNMYCSVQYGKYTIPSGDCLKLLTANNYEVDAYYLPDADGLINEVHLFQNGNFICTASKQKTYNESSFEQSEADKNEYKNQAAYVARFDKKVKDGKSSLQNITVMKNTAPLISNEEPVKELVNTIINNEEMNDMNDEHDADYWNNKAISDL
jgi:hypothetical protein